MKLPYWLKLVLILFLFSLIFVRVYNKDNFFFYPGKGDDAGYYVFTEALFKTHTLNWCDPRFSVQFTDENTCVPGEPIPYNKYAVGPAVLLAPFSLLGQSVESFGLFAPAGTTLIFWSVVGTFFLFVAGALLWLACAFEITGKKKESFWITLCFLSGNIILYYVFRRPFLAHTSEFFLMALGFYLVSYIVRQNQIFTRHSALLGFAGGALAIVRYNDFPISIFFFLSLLFCLQKKSQKYIKHLLVFSVTAALPVIFFLIIYFMQKHSVMYRPSDYDHLTGYFLLYRFRWSNLHRLYDLFFSFNWGIFWLCPFFFFELFVVTKNRKFLAGWISRNRSWFYSALFLCLICVNIVINFDGSGMSYANRYFLPITYFMHLFFLMAVKYSEKNLFQGIPVKAAVIVAVALASFNVINYESNNSTLTLTGGPLIDDGIYELPRRDMVELRGNKFAYHSLAYTISGRALQNLGASPILAYPLMALKPWLKNFSVTQKAYDYYSSPKRHIEDLEDLKYLRQYHLVILILLLLCLGVAYARVAGAGSSI